MDQVALLRTVLAPELVKRDDVGLRAPFPIWTALPSALFCRFTGWRVLSRARPPPAKEDMADCLRIVTDALQSGDGPLPMLSGLPPVEAEPAF
jgi:hypothetical protein